MTDASVAVSDLSPRHCTVAMFGLRGLTHKKIGELTGYSQSRVTQILGSAAVKDYQRSLADKQAVALLGDPVSLVKDELDRQALPAVRRVVKLMNGSSNERIQLNAANSLLDRTVPRKIQTAPPAATFVLPDKVAERLLKVLGETAQLEAAIDVTPDDSETD
jgi:hypothetical protein